EFNNSIESEEEFDANYVSDTKNFYDFLQIKTNNYPEPEDDESDYDIEDVINTSITNK
ncbi:42446_t:CDS:2, partial [Gigaspora margarita]